MVLSATVGDLPTAFPKAGAVHMSVPHATTAFGRVAMGGMKQVEVHARQQFGVVSRRQLIHAGLGRSSIAWKLKTGELERVSELVYRIRGAVPCWQRSAMEGLLICGPGSALSHATAAWLHRLDGFSAPTIVDVSRASAAPRPIEGVRFHRDPRVSPQNVITDIWRITGVQRTLVDLAGQLDDQSLEIALDSAQRRYKYAGDWLEAYLKELKPQGTPGLSRLIELFNLRRGVVTDSPLEVKVLRKLRQVGLLPTDTPFEVYEHDGTYVMRLDFAWASLKIALHVDGYLWHQQRERFDRDAKQRSRLQVLGWRCVTVTSRNFDDGSWLEDLRALLNPQRELALG